jgi:hypothetical protein
MKPKITIAAAFTLAALLTTLPACSDFLDVVPDNMPTIEHAFRTRSESSNYLAGIYGYMPYYSSPTSQHNFAVVSTDEIWRTWSWGYYEWQLWTLASNQNSTTSPYANHYNRSSSSNTGSYWRGLRDINIFLENIHLPYDLEEWERIQWVAEAKFFKAYYHWLLFRQYGPIPLIRDNIPVFESGETVQMPRQPVDDCVQHICDLLDEAGKDLPIRISDEMRDMGRPTRLICRALKAKVLTYAASPLFNCNKRYAEYLNKDGTQLFPQDESVKALKWERARDALKEAIDMAHNVGFALYDFRTAPGFALQARNLSDSTVNAMQVRGAIVEPWNTEIIWGDPRGLGCSSMWVAGFPALNDFHLSYLTQNLSPGVDITRKFYTDHGIPIEDDASWQGKDVFALKQATWLDRQYIRVGETCITLNFDREPRFYGALGFNGSTFYGNGVTSADNALDADVLPYYSRLGTVSADGKGSPTGYLWKKFIHPQTTIAVNGTSAVSGAAYPFPVIRLADLYLMYAEVLNECKAQPDAEVYEWIDRVRNRTGLEGVVASWSKYATSDKKNRPADKDEMRDIIHRERTNELMFEGHRFWDQRRWLTAETELSGITCRVIYDVDTDTYNYTIGSGATFQPKDYFQPIANSILLLNPNLLQSPGWGIDADAINRQ